MNAYTYLTVNENRLTLNLIHSKSVTTTGRPQVCWSEIQTALKKLLSATHSNSNISDFV